MQRTRFLFFLLIVIFVVGYAWGLWSNLWGHAWYLRTGNTYFHALGGLVIALFIASYYANQFGKLSQPFRFFCLVGIVMGVGVLWEFHEYLMNQIVGYGFQGDLDDTMLDLLMDTSGAVIASFLNPFRS